ncbi:MAG: FAD-dependent oxidoreductase [Rectinema subterraneum]|uniref:FAD-dependent oxidoreductase n=1 Tax=Rectinema subterraneum TaxID=2653714 RepID=UPI003C7E79F1
MKDPSLISPSEIPLMEMLTRFFKDPLTQMKILPLLFNNAASVLRRFTKSIPVMQFFDKLTSTYCYTTMEETPAIMAVTMFVENHRSGSYYIHGSTQIYVGKLEKAIEKYGGSLAYGTDIVALDIDGGSITAARCADGSKIEADYFIYSGTVWNLYQKLLPAGKVPPALLKKAADTVPTPSSIVLYATVKKEAFPQDIGPIEMLVQDTDALTESEITLYIPTIDDPSLNEPGYHSILAIGPSFRTWPSPESLAKGDGMLRAAYEQAKNEEAERIINYLASYFPDFKANLVDWEIGSPVTIERYSLKNKGSVAGPKQMVGQDLMHRQHAETRWKNLLCCGESTTMGTGTPAVVISGLSAADVILRREGLPEYRYFSDKGYVQYLKSPAPAYAGDGLRKIGNLCLWCEHDACRQVCPHDMDIRGMFRRFYSENLEGARNLVKYSADCTDELVCLQCEKKPCVKACRKKAILGEAVPIPEVLAELFSPMRHREPS